MKLCDLKPKFKYNEAKIKVRIYKNWILTFVLSLRRLEIKYHEDSLLLILRQISINDMLAPSFEMVKNNMVDYLWFAKKEEFYKLDGEELTEFISSVHIFNGEKKIGYFYLNYLRRKEFGRDRNMILKIFSKIKYKYCHYIEISKDLLEDEKFNIELIKINPKYIKNNWKIFKLRNHYLTKACKVAPDIYKYYNDYFDSDQIFILMKHHKINLGKICMLTNGILVSDPYSFWKRAVKTNPINFQWAPKNFRNSPQFFLPALRKREKNVLFISKKIRVICREDILETNKYCIKYLYRK